MNAVMINGVAVKEAPEGWPQSNWFELGVGARPGIGKFLVSYAEYETLRDASIDDGYVVLKFWSTRYDPENPEAQFGLGPFGPPGTGVQWPWWGPWLENLEPNVEIQVEVIGYELYSEALTEQNPSGFTTEEMVEVVVADRRFAAGYRTGCSKLYNIQKAGFPYDDSFEPIFYGETLDTGSEWTWTTMFADLWPLVTLDADYSLPVGFTPRNLALIHNVKYDAFDRAAALVGALVKWDYEDNEYELMGYDKSDEDNDDFGNLIEKGLYVRREKSNPNTDDDYIRVKSVQFLFKQVYSGYLEYQGGASGHWHNVTETLDASAHHSKVVYPGYWLAIKDSGTVQNATELEAVAAAHASKYEEHEEELITVAGIYPVKLDAEYRRIRWESNRGGAVTKVRKRSDDPIGPGVTKVSNKYVASVSDINVEPSLDGGFYVSPPSLRSRPAMLQGVITGVTGLVNAVYDYQVVGFELLSDTNEVPINRSHDTNYFNYEPASVDDPCVVLIEDDGTMHLVVFEELDLKTGIAEGDVLVCDSSPTASAGNYGRFTADGIEGVDAATIRSDINVEDGADVTDATNVDAAGAVMESDFSANEVITADHNGNMAMVSLGQSSFLGRKSGATADPESLTGAEARTILNVEDGADVTDEANVRTALASASGNVAFNGQNLTDFGYIGFEAKEISLGGTPLLGVVPRWYVVEIDESDYTAGGFVTLEDITAFVLPSRGVIHDTAYIITEQAAGCATANVQVGIGADPNKYTGGSAINWLSAVNTFGIFGTSATPIDGANLESVTGTTNIIARLTTILGCPPADLTAGTLKFYVLMSKIG